MRLTVLGSCDIPAIKLRFKSHLRKCIKIQVKEICARLPAKLLARPKASHGILYAPSTEYYAMSLWNIMQ